MHNMTLEKISLSNYVKYGVTYLSLFFCYLVYSLVALPSCVHLPLLHVVVLYRLCLCMLTTYSYCCGLHASSEVRTVTYMEGRQLQHPGNVNSRQPYDCSSEEKTHFQYIPHYSRIQGQFLVQM